MSQYSNVIKFPSLRAGLVVSLFWLSLLPYHFKQYVKVEYGAGSPLLSKACYALVGALLVLTFLSASLSRRSRTLIRIGIRSNPYALIYSLWIIIGQTVGVVLGNIGMGSLALASAYSVTAFVGFYVVPSFLSRSDRIDLILRTILYVGFMVSISGIIASITGSRELLGVTFRTEGKLPFLPFPQSTGFLHEYNIYGLTAGLGFWGTCYFLVQEKKISYIIIAGVCLLSVFFSESRAIYLAVAIGIVILVKPFKTKWYKKLLFGVTVLGGVTLGFYIAFGTEWGARLLGTDLDFAHALAGRAVLWPAAVSAIANQPVYGYGFAGDAFKEAIYNHGAAILSVKPMPAHNAFLDISLRGGVLLGILYIFVVVRSVQRLLRAPAASGTYEEKMRSRILSIILITVFLAALFMPHSLGGIGYVSLVLTTFAGIANYWPELMVRTQN